VQRETVSPSVLPQKRFETAVVYMAVLQMARGGHALSQLFGPGGARIPTDSEAVVAICDQPLPAFARRATIASLLLRWCDRGFCDGTPEGTRADPIWISLLAQEPAEFRPVDTLAGRGRRAHLHQRHHRQTAGWIPHRALIGNLTGFVCSQNWFRLRSVRCQGDFNGGVLVPADWAWTGG
jgi:acetyl-CoA synthetase